MLNFLLSLFIKSLSLSLLVLHYHFLSHVTVLTQCDILHFLICHLFLSHIFIFLYHFVIMSQFVTLFYHCHICIFHFCNVSLQAILSVTLRLLLRHHSLQHLSLHLFTFSLCHMASLLRTHIIFTFTLSHVTFSYKNLFFSLSL